MKKIVCKCGGGDFKVDFTGSAKISFTGSKGKVSILSANTIYDRLFIICLNCNRPLSIDPTNSAEQFDLVEDILDTLVKVEDKKCLKVK